MPPFHSRSTGILRIARITSFGVADAALETQHRLHRRRQRDRLRRAQEDAAAARDLLAVVVFPRRAGQGEQPLALRERRCRIRRRVEEDVLMIERRLQPHVRRQQHAVAEHVTRHVADAAGRELLRLNVDAELAEVALHALPRAAGRDAHALVVVTGGAARRERIAQPEARTRARSHSRCRRTSPCPCRPRRRDRHRRDHAARRSPAARCGR